MYTNEGAYMAPGRALPSARFLKYNRLVMLRAARHSNASTALATRQQARAFDLLLKVGPGLRPDLSDLGS